MKAKRATVISKESDWCWVCKKVWFAVEKRCHFKYQVGFDRFGSDLPSASRIAGQIWVSSGQVQGWPN